MFSPDQLKDLIQNRLSAGTITIPNGHTKAIFGFVDAQGNVNTGVAYKTGTGWQIEGDLDYHPHSSGLSAGLNVFKTWG